MGALQLLRHARHLHAVHAEGAAARQGRSLAHLRQLHRSGLLDAPLGRLHGGPLLGQPQVDHRRRRAHGLGPVLHVRLGQLLSRHLGSQAADVRRPGVLDLRQRLLQAEHLDDGGPAVSGLRQAHRQRVHHLLHGHQPRRVHRAVGVRLLWRHRSSARLPLGLPRRWHWHGVEPRGVCMAQEPPAGDADGRTDRRGSEHGASDGSPEDRRRVGLIHRLAADLDRGLCRAVRRALQGRRDRPHRQLHLLADGGWPRLHHLRSLPELGREGAHLGHLHHRVLRDLLLGGVRAGGCLADVLRRGTNAARAVRLDHPGLVLPVDQRRGHRALGAVVRDLVDDARQAQPRAVLALQASAGLGASGCRLLGHRARRGRPRSRPTRVDDVAVRAVLDPHSGRALLVTDRLVDGEQAGACQVCFTADGRVVLVDRLGQQVRRHLVGVLPRSRGADRDRRAAADRERSDHQGQERRRCLHRRGLHAHSGQLEP